MRKLTTLAVFMIFALPLAAQVQIDDTPRRYLKIKVDGASKDWEIRPIRITDRVGGNLDSASPAELKTNVERWDRTGLPKRYHTEAWKKAFERHLGTAAPDGGKFWFYTINPKKPHPEGIATVVDERKGHYWVDASKVTIQEYPATWVNLFEGFVERREGEARQSAVKDWEAAHSEIIENVDDKPDGFTQEERNEFAKFYQEQFVYIRDRNPKQASIYVELAEFHASRNNLDAELSVYLAALRSGVESPAREDFALQVGRINFHRLQLWEEAEWSLKLCQNFSEARYLLALTLTSLGRLDEARTLLRDTVTLINAADESLQLELTAEEEVGRLNLALAKLEFLEGNFSAAEEALSAIPPESADNDAGKVLTCAMLQHRDRGKVGRDKPDYQKIRDIVVTLSFWNDALTYANPKNTDFPLDTLMAEAMLRVACTSIRGTSARPCFPSRPGLRLTPQIRWRTFTWLI
ncbi:MAG: tetratricopeptide repeat protein [Planctomycetota bacterium]|jgi:tetratricopeptide (TPR) repeat protein